MPAGRYGCGVLQVDAGGPVPAIRILSGSKNRLKPRVFYDQAETSGTGKRKGIKMLCREGRIFNIQRYAGCYFASNGFRWE